MQKANGLRELGKILNIKLSEMCAFGDGGNDLEMIRRSCYEKFISSTINSS